jgi:hypothetical protein
MSLSDLIEKLGKTIFEAPFEAAMAPKDAPELAEIRLAVLDHILKKGHPAGGKIVFPYNLVRIHVRGAAGDESVFLQSAFLKSYFEQEIRKSLKRSNYRFPDDLEVEFSTSGELPGDGEPWFRVETECRPARGPAAVAPRRTARLVVTRGTATQQGPSRRNSLAFTEENEINCTVSREHAHVVHFKKTGEYRLYNDRVYKLEKKQAGNCGLWIIRDGLSQEVHRNARGVKLKPGDEIQLGRALIRFELK